MIEANRTGGPVKRIHCGWAVQSGVTATTLARSGIAEPPTVLEGRFGFFQAWLDGRYDAIAPLGELGERCETVRTVYKPYPSDHFTHPAIECALALRAGGLDPADAVQIELGIAAPTLRTVAEAVAEKIRPRTPYHAKCSGPLTRGDRAARRAAASASTWTTSPTRRWPAVSSAWPIPRRAISSRTPSRGAAHTHQGRRDARIPGRLVTRWARPSAEPRGTAHQVPAQRRPGAAPTGPASSALPSTPFPPHPP